MLMEAFEESVAAVSVLIGTRGYVKFRGNTDASQHTVEGHLGVRVMLFRGWTCASDHPTWLKRLYH